MRVLKQPGPVAAERIESLAAPLEYLEFVLEPGRTLNDAVSTPLLAAGFTAAAVSLSEGSLAPFRYVMPAASPDPNHAAWYSETFSPPGETRIEAANITFGSRDGGPFTHCHAIWRTADGVRGGGHILPLETLVASPIPAHAWGTKNARIVSRMDAETNFMLFTPEGDAALPLPERPLLLARLRPNIDVCTALEEVCRRHGITHARVRGSLGSVVGAVFDDAPALEDHATEFLVLDGTVAPGASGELAARLRIAIVGLSGTLREGWLTRGRNGVCITCEFALEGLKV